MGLYNARNIAIKYGGALTVSLDEKDDVQIIVFRVEI